jgi:hypothetical protein
VSAIESRFRNSIAVSRSEMADSKTLLEHQVEILNLKSRAKRLEYSIKNFPDIGKAYNKSLSDKPVRGGGRTHASLIYGAILNKLGSAKRTAVHPECLIFKKRKKPKPNRSKVEYSNVQARKN